MHYIPCDHVCLLLVKREDGGGVDDEDGAEERDNDEDEDEDEDDGAREEGGGGNGENENEDDGAREEEEEDGEVWFSLNIPLDIIDSLCLTPRKYLLYVGWCIIGLDDAACQSLALGIANEDGTFRQIDDEGDLEGGGIYILIFGDPPPYMAVVDMEVIKARTAVSSETTGTRIGFRTQLIERDVRCIFTGIEAGYSQGLHIIPFKRGSEWFRLIIQNRPHENLDDLNGLNDISDIRNGFLAAPNLHMPFDSRKLVILKTPNRILGVDDIPPRHVDPLQRFNDVELPENIRYTAQWLDPPEYMQYIIPNNKDAAFSKTSVAKKPSALLLHYNYGAAAVKNWGLNTHILKLYAEKSRPPKPDPIRFESPKQVHDTIKKRKNAMAAPESKKASASKGEKCEAAWDEDDVMLFMWGNSRAARERYHKAHEAARGNIEQWRQGVPT